MSAWRLKASARATLVCLHGHHDSVIPGKKREARFCILHYYKDVRRQKHMRLHNLWSFITQALMFFGPGPIYSIRYASEHPFS